MTIIITISTDGDEEEERGFAVSIVEGIEAFAQLSTYRFDVTSEIEEED